MRKKDAKRGTGYYRLTRRSALGGLGMAAGSVATIVLAGCASRKSGVSKGSASAGKAGTPKYGGQVNLSTPFEITSFDPTVSPDPQEASKILSLTNDPLLGFKAGPNVPYNELDLEPRLAERWEQPDAQTYIFHLRPGLKFADVPPVNGRPVTSADAQWTFEYATRMGSFKSLPPSHKGQFFQGLDQVVTPDASTVRMHLTHPFAPFLSYAATPYGSILPYEIFDQDGNFNKRIVGTGPWQFDPGASQKGARQVFKKNAAYFLPGRPYIDQVNRLILPDNATVNSAFQARQVGILDYNGLSFDTVEQMKKAVPTAVSYDYLRPGPDQFFINATRPPLRDLRVRRALALSVDHEELLRTILKGRGAAALTGSIPGVFTPEETKQILKHDPAQARQLLRAAGYANGLDLELVYPGSKYGEASVAECQLVQAQLKQGGINLVLHSLDSATEGSRKHSDDFQLDYGMLDIQVDIDSYLYGFFDPKSGNNYSKVDDPELTPLLEAQRRETDPAKRSQLWRQAIQRINDQAWAVAFLYRQQTDLWWPYLKNYAPNWGWTTEPLSNSWLEK